jgi:hypothetical protein
MSSPAVIRAINNCRKALVRKAFRNTICAPTPRSPARLVRYYFSRIDTPRILSCLRSGPVSQDFLAARRVRADLNWRRALEAAAGTSTMATRSLATVHSFGTRISPGCEGRRYACQRKVAAGGATRYGDEGPLDRPPSVNTDTEGFRLGIPYSTFFAEGAPIHVFYLPLP